MTALVAALVASACKSEPATPIPSPGSEWLSFEEINAWHYTNGLDGIPAEVQARSGTRVTMQGMVVPLDNDPDFGEALLADDRNPWVWDRGGGPRMNSVVRVILPAGVKLSPKGCMAKCTGTFVAQATMLEDYCLDIYQLHADLFEVIEFRPRQPMESAR